MDAPPHKHKDANNSFSFAQVTRPKIPIYIVDSFCFSRLAHLEPFIASHYLSLFIVIHMYYVQQYMLYIMFAYSRA